MDYIRIIRKSLLSSSRPSMFSEDYSFNGLVNQRHWDWSFADVNLRWDCRATLDDGSPMCIVSPPLTSLLVSWQLVTFKIV